MFPQSFYSALVSSIERFYVIKTSFQIVMTYLGSVYITASNGYSKVQKNRRLNNQKKDY